MKTSLITGAGMVVLVGIILGVYSFNRGNTSESLIAKRNELQSNLIAAQNTLNTETERLDNMTNSLRNAFPLASNVQDQMTRSSNLVKDTNFMFRNAEGANPEIIIKNLENSALLNSERKEINLFLATWKGRTSVLSISEFDGAMAQQIKQEAQKIKTYIENLTEFVASLTPANSGLSQFTIDTYADQLPTVDSINAIIAAIDAAIATPDALNFQIASTGNTGTTTTTNTGNPTPTPSPTPSSSAPIAPATVVIQQSVVANAEAQVNNLQQQLAQVEQQIQQTSPAPAPELTPTPASPTPSPSSGNQNTPTPTKVPPKSGTSTSSQGIIIQPGPPRLIQGVDPF